MAARSRPPGAAAAGAAAAAGVRVRDLYEDDTESALEPGQTLQERLAALSLGPPASPPPPRQQQRQPRVKEAHDDPSSSSASSDEGDSASGSGNSMGRGRRRRRQRGKGKSEEGQDGGGTGEASPPSPAPKASRRTAKAMKKQRAVDSTPSASGSGSPESGATRRQRRRHRRRSGKGQEEAGATAGGASVVVVEEESVVVMAAVVRGGASAVGAAVVRRAAAALEGDAASIGGSTVAEDEEEGGGGSGSGDNSAGATTTKKKKKKKPKEKKPKKAKPLPGLVASLELLRAGLAAGTGVLEVHVPTCACRAADWRRGMEADGVVGFVAATVAQTSHAKPLAALVGDPDPAHTLEGEQRALALLQAAALGHSQLKAARCARLTTEATLGPPSFLHGAAMVVGERAHLEALARAYGFRPQAQRRAEDEACCLLVAPLPASGMYGGGGMGFSRASVRMQAVAGRFLEMLTAAHARGPGKREQNRVEHHLRTALSALTREGVLRAVGRGTVLAEPAILAMGQEWPERYTVDAFGGKRELGESSLEAAVRETREESGGAIRLDDARRFVRLPALDMRDNAMAFFGFLFREHLGTNVRPVPHHANPYATRSQTQRWGGGFGAGLGGSAPPAPTPAPSLAMPTGGGGSAVGGRGGRGRGGRGGRG